MASRSSPPVVQATVVQATPVQSRFHEADDADYGKGSRPPVMATVVQAPMMGQTVVGQPVVIGTGVPGDRWGSHVGHPGLYGSQAGYGPQAGLYAGGLHGPYTGLAGVPAEDPTIPAILACFCCCWCVGIVAIIKAQEVQQLNMQGNFPVAHEKRKEAMTWIYITVGTGIIFSVANFILRMALGSQDKGHGG